MTIWELLAFIVAGLAAGFCFGFYIGHMRGHDKAEAIFNQRLMRFEVRKPEATDPERIRRQHSRNNDHHSRQSTAHMSALRHYKKS